jgi:HEAT repeat protein
MTVRRAWEQIIADLYGVEDDVDRAVAACSALDAAADESRLPELRRLLMQGDNFFVREAAAFPVARLEGLRALPALVHAKQRGSEEGHDNDGLNTLMADLVESHQVEAVPLLLRMLAEPSEESRSAAAWLLGFVAEAASPDALLAVLDDPSPHVRAAAAGSLSSFPNISGVADALIRLLGADVDEQVRVSAASALGYLGDKRALPALRRAFEDPEERVRTFASYAVSKLESA